jgi:nicotinate-nucleotide adenylyltransferase
VGHLVAAVNARAALQLDRVILMVANVPWQKAGHRVVTSAEDRLAMVEAAVGDVPGLEAGRQEIDRGGDSYTADTLAGLAATNPGAELFLIVGWDVAAELTTWDRWEEIQQLATLVVVNRPGAGRPAGLDGDGWRVAEVTVPNLEISSTDLRERAATGRPLDYLMPEAAVRCLRARGLYATSR